MMTPFESAVRSSLEGSHGGRVLVRDDHRATALHHYRGLNCAAAAMLLALVPLAMLVAGVWMAAAGLITGAQWALDVDGSVWLGIGRWLVVGAGLAGAGYALFASARWVVGLAETWKGRGMPSWPRWRR